MRDEVRGLLKESSLHTVCEAARCPNLSECFSRRTATVLILGDRCTRNCAFCAVEHGAANPPDPEEPNRVADLSTKLGLRYIVVTSVTRDDLADGGAHQFAETIRAIRTRMPSTGVEVLVPDFQGSEGSLRVVLEAGPDVLNHNMETVPRLYSEVRRGADYRRSLRLLRSASDFSSSATKSGLMLGLGETAEEVRGAMADLVEAGCRILTLGQYLRPSPSHYPVKRYVHPEEFEKWEGEGRDMGFEAVTAGPFVRSSYRAGEVFQTLLSRNRD